MGRASHAPPLTTGRRQDIGLSAGKPYLHATEERRIATICKAGKRSGLAASVLQREGFDVAHVLRAA